jgi:hypothetical protein
MCSAIPFGIPPISPLWASEMTDSSLGQMNDCLAGYHLATTYFRHHFCASV